MKKSTLLIIIIPMIMMLPMILIPALVIYADDAFLDNLPFIIPLIMFVVVMAIVIISVRINSINAEEIETKVSKEEPEMDKESVCPHCGSFIGYGDRNYCPNCGKKIDDRLL